MQTLFKILLDEFIENIFIGIFIKIFLKPSVKGTLRYRKIKFLTTSALFQLHYLRKEEEV
jgi:hypothetical protein